LGGVAEIVLVETRGQVELLGEKQVALDLANVDIALRPCQYAAVAFGAVDVAVDEDRPLGAADRAVEGVQLDLVADDEGVLVLGMDAVGRRYEHVAAGRPDVVDHHPTFRPNRADLPRLHAKETDPQVAGGLDLRTGGTRIDVAIVFGLEGR